MLLSIFHTGGLTLVLTIVWALLTAWFLKQTIQTHNANTPKVPLFQIPTFWFAVVTTALFLFAIILVGADYKGV